MTAHKSWLWPDRTIGMRESRALREEHNAVVNSHAELLSATASFLDAYGAGEFDDPCKVVPYIKRFEDAIASGGPDEPDRAGCPDMDSAGGDDSLDRAYREKRG